ncbi:MAG: glycolate oxidase subunit GlcE [Rhodospirillaceae bacterium]
MADDFKVDNDAQVLDTLKWAAAEGKSLEVRGAGTKRGLGRPIEADHVLDVSALSSVTYYEPAELVLSCGAATSVAEIEALLAGKGQQLAFEPPDMGPLMGGAADAGTMGGLLACNLAGPRRIKAGSARDHFLGFNAVSGRGEMFKSGGRVVKNVTGFDLSKLMAGSFGTLAVMTEVSVKVLPAAEKIRTVLISWAKDGIYDHGGVSAMNDALASPHEVSGAAHLPAAIAKRSAVDYVAGSGRAVTAIRVEGPEPSVAHRCEQLRAMLGKYGDTEELHTENSAVLWREVRNVACFVDNQDRDIWRSVPPAMGSKVALKIFEGRPGEALYDWGGGLIWLALNPTPDARANVVRQAVAEVGGHALLVRAPEAVRDRVPVFEPQDGPLADIARRIKEGFDPNGILNPGRMYEEF